MGVLVLASAVIVLASIGTAGAAAGHHAKTRVTIQAWPDGLFGVVKSPRANNCAKRRHVTLFKKKGAHRNPSRDERVGGDVARRNNGFYQWTVQTGETGPLYAKAGRTKGCDRGLSKTFKVRPHGDIHQCSSAAPADVCSVGLDRMFTTSPSCQNYTASLGSCSGTAIGPDEWGSSGGDGRQATFGWLDVKADQNVRIVDYAAKSNTDPKDRAFISGHTFNYRSTTLIVDKAQMTTAGDAWVGYTPNISGVPPGLPGGPFSFSIEPQGGGRTEIHFRGYLYKKP